MIGTLVYLAFNFLTGGNVSLDNPGQARTTGADNPSPVGASGTCEGASSSSNQGEFVACVQNNVQKFWTGELRGYHPAKLVLFTNATQSECGPARASTGPFYCPEDHEVYLDVGFFDELRSRFHAKGGDFAEAYVVAHEYGHHVQSLMGTERAFMQQVTRSPSKQNALSVKLELQADCYAGVWGHSAYATGKVSHDEIAQALDAAAAVGDDRIQEQVLHRVTPEKFTHGSAAERQRWFQLGMDSGDPKMCDTFEGALER